MTDDDKRNAFETLSEHLAFLADVLSRDFASEEEIDKVIAEINEKSSELLVLKNSLEKKYHSEAEEYGSLYNLGRNLVYLIEFIPKSFLDKKTTKIIEKLKIKSVEIQELRNSLDRDIMKKFIDIIPESAGNPIMDTAKLNKNIIDALSGSSPEEKVWQFSKKELITLLTAFGNDLIDDIFLKNNEGKYVCPECWKVVFSGYNVPSNLIRDAIDRIFDNIE